MFGRYFDSAGEASSSHYSQSRFEWPSLTSRRTCMCQNVYRFAIKCNILSIRAYLKTETFRFFGDKKSFSHKTSDMSKISTHFHRKVWFTSLSFDTRAITIPKLLFSSENARRKIARSSFQSPTAFFFKSTAVFETLLQQQSNVAVGALSSRTFLFKLENCSIFRKWTHVGNFGEKYVWTPPAQTMPNCIHIHN